MPYSLNRFCAGCRRVTEFRSHDNRELWCTACGWLRYGGAAAAAAVSSSPRRRRRVGVYAAGTWLDRSQPPDN